MDPAVRAWFQSLGLTPAARSVAPAPRPWRPKPIDELVPGEAVHTPHGAFFLARQVYRADYRHGERALTELLAYPGTAGAALARDPRLAGLDLSRLAFVDVETTGLAGGTGTICFLIGVGCFENGSFVLYQFFMRTLHEEAAQLSAVSYTGLYTAQECCRFCRRTRGWPARRLATCERRWGALKEAP